MYSFNSHNDTIDIQYFYYNDENLLDSLITIHHYMNKRISKKYYKYANKKLIFYEYVFFSKEGVELDKYIVNYEYHSDFLMNLTSETWKDGEYENYIKYIYYYNNNDELLKRERINSESKIIDTNVYFHEDGRLVKIEYFGADNILYSYTIIEDECNMLPPEGLYETSQLPFYGK